jgi:RHS repeat-associated protein
LVVTDFDATGQTLCNAGYYNYDPLGFTGAVDSYGGLWKLGARFYDSSKGSFIQQDRYMGDPEEPLSLNRYIYCNLDPVNFVDPTGFHKQDKWYGYNDKKFQQWYHRQYKEGGGDIQASKDVIKDAYEEWQEEGCPGPDSKGKYGNKGGKNDNQSEISTTAVKTGVVLTSGYLIYRIIRFLPSLFPPLWETIPANLAIP